ADWELVEASGSTVKVAGSPKRGSSLESGPENVGSVRDRSLVGLASKSTCWPCCIEKAGAISNGLNGMTELVTGAEPVGVDRMARFVPKPTWPGTAPGTWSMAWITKGWPMADCCCPAEATTRALTRLGSVVGATPPSG